MKLFIVESPAKARTIKSYLGKEYIVLATKGHIKDLPQKEMGIDIKTLEPKYVILPGRRKVISYIIKVAKNSETIFLASDKDREGEIISFHLKEILSRYVKDIKRIEFTEVTKNGILNSLKTPRDINMSLVNAQKTRRVLDRIVGYVLSPILYRNLKNEYKDASLSAGRVQSPALRLICERELDIKNFKQTHYYEVIIHCDKDGKKYYLKLISEKVNGREIKFSPTNRIDEGKLKEIKENFNRDRVEVVSFKRYDDYIKPLPPFKTSTLQQDASAKLSFSPSKTMKIAQELYEGMNIDGEFVGLITYMRTDSVRISDYALKRTREFIRDRIGPEYLPPTPRIYESSSPNEQGAHECIRPTDIYRVPTLLKNKIPEDHYRLYDLIWRRFLASQMKDAVLSVLEVLASDGKYYFFGISKRLVEEHFMKFYPHSVPEDVFLPILEKGERIKVLDLEAVKRKTQPPPRYTEATLIKKLEDEGIGRPSTYATIVSTLLARKYVVKENKSLVPTELGFKVYEFLKFNYPTVIDLKLTSRMEETLDKIENDQEKDWKKALLDMIREIKVPFEI
ncbi:MAG: type I DNA topoisomerase [Spirochaetia bacterium]|nr:type I DNA topoisomerase [Spirochaetota bacterium]MCX8095992.1 type I DNA topoisomerase [Spirochaetota bacterium]MDW8112509.1 type I DNA topoisomerase [Spirochaetia bacterium]